MRGARSMLWDTSSVRPPGIQPHDEALMPAAVGVVRQHPHHGPLPRDLLLAGAVGEDVFEDGIGVAPCSRGTCGGRDERETGGNDERGGP